MKEFHDTEERLIDLGFIQDSEFENVFKYPGSRFDYVIEGSKVEIWINLEYTVMTLSIDSIETFLNLEKYGY